LALLLTAESVVGGILAPTAAAIAAEEQVEQDDGVDIAPTAGLAAAAAAEEQDQEP